MYVDHAATTPVRPEVLDAMLKRLSTTDQALDRQGTPFLLKRMDDVLAELDLKLASCGIRAR